VELLEWPNVRLDGAGWGAHGGRREPLPGLLLRGQAPPGKTLLQGGAGPRREWSDPLAALSWMEASLRGELRGGRWVGWLSYDLGRLFESLPSGATDDLSLPLFQFTYHPPVQSEHPVRAWRTIRDARPCPPRWNFTRASYTAAVRRALEYIAAGDVFQVNLSQRCSVALPRQPGSVYERLLARTPAAYGALLDYHDHAIVSNSPELFLRVRPHPDGSGRRQVLTRPIKGTRPNAPGMLQQLRDSAKDEAELNMIVDLERNDLGRVCEVGSVKVTERRAIEEHPTVYHGVATVAGALRPDVGFVDLLRATFPGGSVTGAPKIRAMQIIDELEPVRRGPYCGAIGYVAGRHDLAFNVAIRTIVVTPDGLAHVSVGGGIVADSDPAAEYEETLVKARATLAALGVTGL